MIKVSNYLEVGTRSRYQLIIGTHNGIFHPDDMLASAFLCLFHSNKSILILRTRKSDLLEQCDICVDIGGDRYDHHQLGFNETRKSGVKYASAGLVWRDYGKQLITLILKHYFPTLKCDDQLIDSIFKTFDEKFVVPVDLEDNGKQKEKHCFSFINSYLPLYFNTSADDFNHQFYKALMATIEVLEQKLLLTISTHLSSSAFKTKLSANVAFSMFLQNLKSRFGRILGNIIINFRYHSINYCNYGILEIPSQTLDWKETVVKINASIPSKIDFVIFPYSDGGWAAQCVPTSLECEFDQRIPFPSEWAGQTDHLPNISGVQGATFCHNESFFARAEDKASIISMCLIARYYNSKAGEP